MVLPAFGQRDLFGGAITAVIPTRLIDASDLRQVPDTQEVFLCPDSDVSIIFEILERVQPDDPQDAAKFHFDSVAHDNSALSSSVDSVFVSSSPSAGNDTPSPVTLIGNQLVAKFNRTTPDRVRILLALYRVQRPNVNIDFVVTCNVPINPALPDEQIAGDQAYQSAKKDFEQVVQSLLIVDYGLFA
ncbi:Mog1p/PsbP-like protein [Punctularia strigosozonata HHB-11173 SS5]|uniref:Mog1p/PsbP-like protein n=1 Tax=Punctularia strigosozonata (strain HHB-11173) TaxID=741275 RepID=R7S2Z8_PUNST|nr:Mog1p/PsbP-like protein [Punctularia strigosozonata HHB-11173 SS5]EIN03631.1 Mog1p/PsbP-like protein [Punctularia strigosozonata HHB-11173 SS5]